jgi:type I restriction enzyme S subunit
MAVYRSQIGKLASYLFQSAILKRQINEHLGATINQITNKSINSFQIPVPPAPEQRSIATALSDVDGLLSGLDRLIDKKRDLKQAAMQKLLTGQARLLGFNGGWSLMKLKELCDYVDGISTLGGDSGYLEIGDINVETKSYDIAQKDKLSVRGAVKVPAGTVLISTVRPTRGAITITKSSLYVSSAFCRVRPSISLFFYLVCQSKFLSYLGENSIGGTYPTCRNETILGYESIVPNDVKEQTAIATIFSDIDDELSVLISRRDKTHALKQAMIQELLTGKTRLV